jgi:hypothetical protein
MWLFNSKLELDRMQLEDELLDKKISLLEKPQEYRFCPGQTDEATEPKPQPKLCYHGSRR